VKMIKLKTCCSITLIFLSATITCHSQESWTPTSLTNAPSPREEHTAVYTGSKMIVWGGMGTSYVNTGGIYDPVRDSWSATSTTNAPDGRRYHTMVWTGSSMIVWGGYGSGFENTGGVYTNDSLVGVTNQNNKLPHEYKLFQNYPNPFNPSTTIQFEIPKPSYTKLMIYDVMGREVMVLVNEELKAGSYKVDFDGSNYSSGVYFYKLISNKFSEIKKMILMK